MKRINPLSLLLQLVFIICLNNVSHAQARVNLKDADIYIHDTLLIEPSQAVHIRSLSTETQNTAKFRPKKDGFRTYHFVTGEKFSSGLEKNKVPEGAWVSWYINGNIDKKVNFVEGKKESAYESWYENGNKNAEGQYENDLRQGDWVFYKEDGSLMGNYKYDKGNIVD